MGLGELESPVGGLGVFAGLVEAVERPPDLPAGRLVRLPRRAADRDDRRPRLLGEGRALDARAREDERAGGRVHPLAVELERGAAALDEVQLLLLVLVLRLVVLVNDPVAGVLRRPCVDAEGRDPEVVPNGPPRLAAVGDLLDLIEMRDCVSGHGSSGYRRFPDSARDPLSRRRLGSCPAEGERGVGEARPRRPVRLAAKLAPKNSLFSCAELTQTPLMPNGTKLVVPLPRRPKPEHARSASLTGNNVV